MKKKILSLTLALLIAASSVIGVSAASFSDTSGHWAESAIERWSGYGVINGFQGKFKPDDKITRGEMAVILDKIMGYKTAAKNTFHDLKEGLFYTQPILKANAAGAMLGDGKGGVRPTANITRQEAAVLISNALGTGKSDSKLQFSDSASVASWAYGYVAAMADRAVVYGDKFRPTVAITRAEVVDMLDRAIEGYVQDAGIYSGANCMEDVVIRAENAVISNSVLYRDVMITEGVGDGVVVLSGNVICGNLIVRGGSKIVLAGCEVYGSIINPNGVVIEELKKPISDFSKYISEN